MARIQDGRLLTVDRARDMINRGGENVYSIEVEATLAGAPGAIEAAVIAVGYDMMGENVSAAIALREGDGTDAVNAHRRGRITDFKIPQYISLHDVPLPLNPGGKVLKAMLRKTAVWTEPFR